MKDKKACCALFDALFIPKDGQREKAPFTWVDSLNTQTACPIQCPDIYPVDNLTLIGHALFKHLGNESDKALYEKWSVNRTVMLKALRQYTLEEVYLTFALLSYLHKSSQTPAIDELFVNQPKKVSS